MCSRKSATNQSDGSTGDTADAAADAAAVSADAAAVSADAATDATADAATVAAASATVATATAAAASTRIGQNHCRKQKAHRLGSDHAGSIKSDVSYNCTECYSWPSTPTWSATSVRQCAGVLGKPPAFTAITR